jgi:hypothetical protein
MARRDGDNITRQFFLSSLFSFHSGKKFYKLPLHASAGTVRYYERTGSDVKLGVAWVQTGILPGRRRQGISVVFFCQFTGSLTRVKTVCTHATPPSGFPESPYFLKNFDEKCSVKGIVGLKGSHGYTLWAIPYYRKECVQQASGCFRLFAGWMQCQGSSSCDH